MLFYEKMLTDYMKNNVISIFGICKNMFSPLCETLHPLIWSINGIIVAKF